MIKELYNDHNLSKFHSLLKSKENSPTELEELKQKVGKQEEEILLAQRRVSGELQTLKQHRVNTPAYNAPRALRQADPRIRAAEQDQRDLENTLRTVQYKAREVNHAIHKCKRRAAK